MMIKNVVSRRNAVLCVVLLFALALSVWLFKAPSALAHVASGGPSTLHHAYSSMTSSRANVLCSGSRCNHRDPYATGCAASMYTVKTAYLNGGSVTGRVELEYSAVCQTNWDQIYSGNGVEYLSGCVVRKAGPDGPFDGDCYHSTVYRWINTNMLWSPHNLDEANGCFQGPCIGDASGLHAGYYIETGYY